VSISHPQKVKNTQCETRGNPIHLLAAIPTSIRFKTKNPQDLIDKMVEIKTENIVSRSV